MTVDGIQNAHRTRQDIRSHHILPHTTNNHPPDALDKSSGLVPAGPKTAQEEEADK